MSLFPSNPQIGDEFLGKRWNGTVWEIVGSNFVGPQGIQGIQGVPGVVTATSPATYDAPTQTVGVDQTAIAIQPSQVAGTAVVDNDTRLLPAGGATGQVLAKVSGTNYDTGWGAPQLVGGAARSFEPKSIFLDGVNGLVCPAGRRGIDNNFATTPDSAATDITGDIDIKAFITADNWTPAANGSPVGKWGGSAAGQSYALFILTDGTIRLSTSNGSSVVTGISTAASGVTDGQPKWIRATLDVDNGASGRTYKFYLSDDGTAWTQLGNTVTVAGTTTINNSSLGLSFAVLNVGYDNPFFGTIHRVIIQSGFDNADNTSNLAFNADFAAQTADAIAFNESSANAAPVTLITRRYAYGIPNSGFTSVSTQALAANTDYFEPFLITEPTVVDLFQWEVTTAPSSTATLHAAIYAATNDEQPTGTPLATWGAISVATSTTGYYSAQIAPVTLQPGQYVFGLNTSVAFTVRAFRRPSQISTSRFDSANRIILLTIGARTNAAFSSSSGWNEAPISNVGRHTFALLRWRPA